MNTVNSSFPNIQPTIVDRVNDFFHFFHVFYPKTFFLGKPTKYRFEPRTNEPTLE